MKLPQVSMSFVWIVLLSGLVSLFLIVGNLTLLGFKRYPMEPYKNLAETDLWHGRQAIVQYGCGGCHFIPGVPGANGRVGPSLSNFRQQMFIAGVLPNEAEHLKAWIQHPQAISPNTAMPDLSVNDRDARNIAAYLYHISEKPYSKWYFTLFGPNIEP